MLLKSIVLLTIIAFVSSNITFGSDYVKVLDDDNFETGVAETNTTLVLFCNSWCKHCKILKPKYETAAILLRHDVPPIALAKIDCETLGYNTCEEFNITETPTLKIFKNGEFIEDYDEEWETFQIMNYMRAVAKYEPED